MALPTFSMRQLVEAGCHFGHATRRWNPKMAPFLYGDRDNIHIIDLRQTMPSLYAAMEQVRSTVAGGGRVLFVGTKRQAQDIVAEEAQRCGQYFVNHRWLGGMLTNWKTISHSIKRLKELEGLLGGESEDLGLTKKERLNLTRELDRLHRALGGIKDMGGQPDLLFVIDTNREGLAIQEAKKLGVPVIAVLDSNSSPTGIDFPIPGNDDAIRAIRLYCSMIAGAALDGIQAELTAAGVDIGAAEEAPVEAVAAPAEEVVAAPAPAPAEEAAPAPATAPVEEKAEANAEENKDNAATDA